MLVISTYEGKNTIIPSGTRRATATMVFGTPWRNPGWSRRLYCELMRWSPSGVRWWLRMNPVTFSGGTTWRFCSRTGKSVPSSAMYDSKGESVPLVTMTLTTELVIMSIPILASRHHSDSSRSFTIELKPAFLSKRAGSSPMSWMAYVNAATVALRCCWLLDGSTGVELQLSLRSDKVLLHSSVLRDIFLKVKSLFLHFFEFAFGTSTNRKPRNSFSFVSPRIVGVAVRLASAASVRHTTACSICSMYTGAVSTVTLTPFARIKSYTHSGRSPMYACRSSVGCCDKASEATALLTRMIMSRSCSRFVPISLTPSPPNACPLETMCCFAAMAWCTSIWACSRSCLSLMLIVAASTQTSGRLCASSTMTVALLFFSSSGAGPMMY
eukprot:PhM_4_TR2074/c0_g1_i1/m.7047